MDFKKIVDKKVVWASKLSMADGGTESYILFEDGSGIHFSDAAEGPIFLDRADEALRTALAEKLDEAESLHKLKAILDAKMQPVAKATETPA